MPFVNVFLKTDAPVFPSVDAYGWNVSLGYVIGHDAQTFLCGCGVHYAADK
jgi:hypothetical protein